MNAMTANNKKLDIFSGSALACGQVASKPRVIGRNRTEMAVFLCLAYERALGRDSHTTPVREKLSAVAYDGFELPGTFESATFENHRRHTMQTISLADAIHDCANVVSFLSEAFSQHPAPKTLELTHSAQTGVSTILALIGDRLYRAAEAIPFNHEMEVR